MRNLSCLACPYKYNQSKHTGHEAILLHLESYAVGCEERCLCCPASVLLRNVQKAAVLSPFRWMCWKSKQTRTSLIDVVKHVFLRFLMFMEMGQHCSDKQSGWTNRSGGKGAHITYEEKLLVVMSLYLMQRNRYWGRSFFFQRERDRKCYKNLIDALLVYRMIWTATCMGVIKIRRWI